ncbi:Hypothetical_protein [Hexamita inflata]|uniref:Hypothetical_protein n=1 Tax=Hexamita inflata TaxID=28002 RepID=A0AA86QD72_9EUKA|nr:Hypothetical protein HINF_LOCUS44661 [Hexamita inflata]
MLSVGINLMSGFGSKVNVIVLVSLLPVIVDAGEKHCLKDFSAQVDINLNIIIGGGNYKFASRQRSDQIVQQNSLVDIFCLSITVYCGRQANFDFKKYQLFQNYFLYQFQLYINSMFSSVSFLFYYFFQPFGHRVNQMIDDIQRDLLQRPLYFFIQQVICGTFFRGNV